MLNVAFVCCVNQVAKITWITYQSLLIGLSKKKCYLTRQIVDRLNIFSIVYNFMRTFWLYTSTVLFVQYSLQSSDFCSGGAFIFHCWMRVHVCTCAVDCRTQHIQRHQNMIICSLRNQRRFFRLKDR